MAVFQELYTQYMIQYMQYMNNISNQPQYQHDQQQQVPPPQQQQPQQQPLPRRPEEPDPVMNAGGGGGMMEDDIGNDRRDRDLLDWMYLLSRVVLLISIVYFYSSISRFLLVAFIGGLVYLYQVKLAGEIDKKKIINFLLEEWCIWQQKAKRKRKGEIYPGEKREIQRASETVQRENQKS